MKLLDSRCLQSCPNGTYEGLQNSILVCLGCDPACKSCAGSGSTACSECNSEYFLEQRTCAAACPAGKYGNRDGNICSQCHQICASCSGPEQTDCLSYRLKFTVSQSFGTEDLSNSQVAFKVLLQHRDGTPIGPSFIAEKIPDTSILQIEPKSALANLKYSQSGPTSILITADFSEGSKGQSLELTFAPDPTKFTADFALVEEPQVLQVQRTEKVD